MTGAKTLEWQMETSDNAMAEFQGSTSFSLSRNIYIIGIQSSGKTPLITALRRHFVDHAKLLGCPDRRS